MKKKNIAAKILILVLAIALVTPSGYLAYSMISEQAASPSEEQEALQQPVVTGQQLSYGQTASVEISSEMQEIIRQADPANFDKNIGNYKTLLIKLDVHQNYRDEMEQLLREGHGLPDVLTAYEFLNENFGMVTELEVLIAEKESGDNWSTVFERYNSRNPEFMPGSFEPEYLEELMSTPGITTDDIMLADRVAQKLSIAVSEVIAQRTAGAAWKDINENYGIVNAQMSIPHVPVTPGQIDRYTTGGLERQQVILAFVIATKLDKNPEEVMDKLKSGESREQIYAGYYAEKYN